MLLLLLSALMIVFSCNKNPEDPEERPKPETGLDSLRILNEGESFFSININPNIKFQTIDNFSASDCWAVQYAGNWPEAKRTAMADWLFSMDTTLNGQPLGIGLSAWRFNIGAGSASQGESSGISDPWRRTQCFMLANGTYNWNTQYGQLWFLQAAKDRGVNSFIGFSNSPPVYFTKNGKAHGSNPDKENLSVDMMPEYSDFLINVIKGIKENYNIEFDYLSPVNEPQWDWLGGQEGSHYSNDTYGNLVNLLSQKLELESSIKTKILVSEAGKWTFLYGEGNTVGNQIPYFFGPGGISVSASSLANIVAGHSYYTTSPRSLSKSIREQVWSSASDIEGLKTWSTEYCPLGNKDLEELGWENWHKDLGMGVALYVSRIIYQDLVFANVSAWQWWLSISPYNYPDGLIYISKNENNGTITDSKLMWTLGNYSRFIQPQSQRIKTESETNEVYVVSFINSSQDGTIVVITNPTDDPIPVNINIEGLSSGSLRPFITSNKENHKLLPMKKINLSDAFEMPGKSVITFIQ